MNRRDAFKTLAGIFGAALVDPTALLSSVRDPLPEPLRIVIPADEGFLIDSVNSIGSKTNACKVLLPGEAGFSIPMCFSNSARFEKIYLPPNTILEMPGESGSMLVLHGVSLRQLSTRLNDIDCIYRTYWMDGRKR